MESRSFFFRGSYENHLMFFFWGILGGCLEFHSGFNALELES